MQPIIFYLFFFVYKSRNLSKNCIGPTIHIGREILCLPYAGFFNYNLGTNFFIEMQYNIYFICASGTYKKLLLKNPAYGRQRISRPMRIVAPIIR